MLSHPTVQTYTYFENDEYNDNTWNPGVVYSHAMDDWDKTFGMETNEANITKEDFKTILDERDK